MTKEEAKKAQKAGLAVKHEGDQDFWGLIVSFSDCETLVYVKRYGCSLDYRAIMLKDLVICP